MFNQRAQEENDEKSERSQNEARQAEAIEAEIESDYDETVNSPHQPEMKGESEMSVGVESS